MVAGTLTITYRTPLPLSTVVTVRSRVHDEQGRKVTLRARLFGADGQLYAEGHALFIRLTPAIEGLFEAALAAGTFRPPDRY